MTDKQLIQKAFDDLSMCVMGFKNSPPKLTKSLAVKILKQLVDDARKTQD